MTQLEDRQIIALFYERSEQAIAELKQKDTAISHHIARSPCFAVK